MMGVLREFLSDLGKSLGAWRIAPLLPPLTLVLQLPFFIPEEWVWLVGVFGGIFYIGYVGTERLWYLAVWRGKNLSPKQVWTFSWRYFGRYFGLGVVSLVPYFLFWIPSLLIVRLLDLGDSLGTGGSNYTLDTIIATFLLDVWLTFMTPALAYSTDRGGEAISIGWNFLKRHWRHAALYVLAPPLASLVLLQRVPEESLNTPLRMSLALVGVLVYLALKGATAALYVRHHGVSIPEDEIDVPRGSAVSDPYLKVRSTDRSRGRDSSPAS